MNKGYLNLVVPIIIQGEEFVDERGSISFVNDFTFDNVKRFYVIKHTSPNTIRAWQAHKKEIKFFYVLRGSFIVNLVKIENWKNPSEQNEVINFRLSKKDKSMLVVPKGYANGFANLESDSELLIFSSSSLEESQKDDYRFDKNYFVKCYWGI